jgi:hypothetical protein
MTVARVWVDMSAWWFYYVASGALLLHLASFLPSSQPIISSHSVQTVSARAVSVRTSDMTWMLTHYTEFRAYIWAAYKHSNYVYGVLEYLCSKDIQQEQMIKLFP